MRPSISESEMKLLKVLWESGPSSGREVHQALRKLGWRRAYTTVLTLLQRLEKKGYVTVDKESVSHTFSAAVSRNRLLRQRLKDLASQLTEGTPLPLVQALVEEHRFSPEEIEQFRGLVDRLDQVPTKPTTKPKPATKTSKRRPRSSKGRTNEP